MAASIMEKINFRPGQSVMLWSYRLAKRITHFQRAALVDLVLDREGVSFNSQHNYVTFSLRYKNVGKQTLSVDMEVQCITVPKGAQEDTKQLLKWDVRNFQFVLAPGEHHTVTGTLQWVPALGREPRLIFPPDNTALISCEYKSRVLGVRYTNEEATLLGLALDRILKEAPSGFTKLRAGVGQQMDDVLLYPCSITVPGAIETSILIPPGDMTPYVSSIMYRGGDKGKAENRYKEILSNLKLAFPNWTVEIARDEANHKRCFLRLEEGSQRIVLSFLHREKDSRYTVILRVEAATSLKDDTDIEALRRSVAEKESDKTPSNSENKPNDLIRIAYEIVDMLLRENYEAIRDKFDERMRAFLSIEMMKRTWNLIQNKVGHYQSNVDVAYIKEVGLDIITVKCKCERGYVYVKIGFTVERKIGAFYLQSSQI
jgi:hypothetical protein